MDGFSALRVNLAGRDPKGRICGGEEYGRFLDALTDELSTLTNIDTGEPVVERVFRADQQVDPVTMGSGPDLTVWWRKSAPIRRMRSPVLGVIAGESPDVRTGEHVMRGMFLVLHAKARRGHHTIESMRAMDVPATLCDLAGVPSGVQFDGVSRRSDFLNE
jgi:predicted AlkP superfamily phosphohydrolase/phosphomutase